MSSTALSSLASQSQAEARRYYGPCVLSGARVNGGARTFILEISAVSAAFRLLFPALDTRQWEAERRASRL